MRCAPRPSRFKTGRAVNDCLLLACRGRSGSRGGVVTADDGVLAAEIDARENGVRLRILPRPIDDGLFRLVFEFFEPRGGLGDDITAAHDREHAGLFVEGHFVSALLDERIADHDIGVEDDSLTFTTGQHCGGAEQSADNKGERDAVQILFHLGILSCPVLGETCVATWERPAGKTTAYTGNERRQRRKVLRM